MIAPRRFLPSMSSLLALEAVERLGSVTAAAEDLALTHSAVSRQLKTLEEQVGVQMFLRKGKGLALTQGGVDFARAVRRCLQDLARASLKIRAAGNRVSLNLAIRPAFGMHWLGPRLRVFARRNPDVMINFATRLAPFDFSGEGFDAAIHYGVCDWPGMCWLELAAEKVIPCAHPDFPGAAPAAAENLMSLPLLHLSGRPGAWEEWFEKQGIGAERLRGMLFDQYDSLTRAAAMGFGVALLPDYLAEPEFAAGRLVPWWNEYVIPQGRYYLVWPQAQEPSRPLASLIGQLRAELNGTCDPKECFDS